MGVWPPSWPRLMYLPTRALAPLLPLPDVLPWPLDSPRPLRLGSLFRGAPAVISWIMLIANLSPDSSRLNRREFAGAFAELHAASLFDLLAVLELTQGGDG